MNAIDMQVNAPQPVTWFVANYYPTDADGQVATEVGVQFKTLDAAQSYARTKLAATGVGVVYIQQFTGTCVYTLYEPVPN